MHAIVDRLVDMCVRLMVEGPFAEWSDAERSQIPFCNAINDAVRAYSLTAYPVATAWLGEASTELAMLRETGIELSTFAPPSLFHDLAFVCFVADAVVDRLDELSREKLPAIGEGRVCDDGDCESEAVVEDDEGYAWCAAHAVSA